MILKLNLEEAVTVNLIGHSICAQGWCIPDRFLSDMELVGVRSGKMHCRVGENSYNVHEGEVILVPPGEVFCQSAPDGPCRAYYAHFSASFERLEQADIPSAVTESREPESGNSYFFELEEPSPAERTVCLPPVIKTGKSRDEVWTLFERALLERNRPAVGYKVMISLYIRQILVLLYRACLNEIPEASEDGKEQKKVVQEALYYIKNHYAEEIDIQQLSRQLFVSYQYLARQFKQSTGVSPVKYLNHLRIEEAKKRIRTADKTLEQIAREVGFENGYYFSRVFRQYEGIPPSKYRSWLNSKNNE